MSEVVKGLRCRFKWLRISYFLIGEIFGGNENGKFGLMEKIIIFLILKLYIIGKNIG